MKKVGFHPIWNLHRVLPTRRILYKKDYKDCLSNDCSICDIFIYSSISVVKFK